MPPLSEARIVRVKNTLHLEDAWVSAPLRDEVCQLENVEVIGPVDPVFETAGQLTNL